MLLPLLLVIAQISRKRLLTPRAIGRVRNGRPGTDALIHAGILKEQRQRTVSTHRVARDGNAARIQLLEVVKDGLGQFLGQVRLHLVVLLPWVADGVNVKRRRATKVVAVVFAWVVCSARRGVWEEKREAEWCGVRVQEALFGYVVGRAG